MLKSYKLWIALALGMMAVSSFGKTFYADKTNAFKACIAPATIFSVDVPCNIKTISYSDNMQGSINKGSPHSAFFMVIPQKDEKRKQNQASFVVACSKMSFSFSLDINKTCTDNHFEVMLPSPPSPSDFSKQDIINLASGLMRAIIKGQTPFGFRQVPVNISENVLGNPDLVAHVYSAYVGGSMVGFVGTITNKSAFVPYTINIPTFMQKGWVLLYVDTPNFKTNTVINPKQTVYFYVVAIKNSQGKYPFSK